MSGSKRQMILVRSSSLIGLSAAKCRAGLVSIDSSGSASLLPDYTALSSQLAAVTPSGVNAGSYNPTNTAAQPCPTLGSDWEASSALPPTPNQELCSCMDKALNCVPSSQIDSNNVGDFFGLVCGLSQSACAGIAANASTGDYGAYGMCNPMQQLGWALNSYYEEQLAAGNGASACDFSGSATTQAAASPTGQCASLISQAGSGGTGTVTSAPTATGGSSSGGSGSSGSGSSSTGSSAGVPGLSTVASLNFGYVQLGLYAVCAFVAGAGMIIL
jgi:1,3-beta-glucanosyltransferase GAS1